MSTKAVDFDGVLVKRHNSELTMFWLGKRLTLMNSTNVYLHACS